MKFVATNPLPTDINLYTFRFHGCCIYTLPLHFRFLWEITVNLSMVSFPLGLLFAKKYVLLLLTLGEMLMECFWFSLFTPLCDRISLSLFSYPLEDRFFISYYSERFTCYLRMSDVLKKKNSWVLGKFHFLFDGKNIFFANVIFVGVCSCTIVNKQENDSKPQNPLPKENRRMKSFIVERRFWFLTFRRSNKTNFIVIFL